MGSHVFLFNNSDNPVFKVTLQQRLILPCITIGKTKFQGVWLHVFKHGQQSGRGGDEPKPICAHFQWVLLPFYPPVYITHQLIWLQNPQCFPPTHEFLPKETDQKRRKYFTSFYFLPQERSFPFSKFCQRRREFSNLLLAHNTSATTFPQGEKRKVHAENQGTYLEHPGSLTTIYHVCDETYFGKHCSNTLKPPFQDSM